jgi:class 3 adenylate cyclase
MLVPLSKLLAISTDQLLGAYDNYNEEIEATVFVSEIVASTHKMQSMTPEDAATWTNGFLFQMTEISIRYDAIPITYIGDGLLCFFSGADHQKRAILAATSAKKVISEAVHIGLHSGIIYPCALGHPDYSRPGIVGNTVNLAFRTSGWAIQNTESGIAATHSIVSPIKDSNVIGKKESVRFKGIDDSIEVYEIIC